MLSASILAGGIALPVSSRAYADEMTEVRTTQTEQIEQYEAILQDQEVQTATPTQSSKTADTATPTALADNALVLAAASGDIFDVDSGKSFINAINEINRRGVENAVIRLIDNIEVSGRKQIQLKTSVTILGNGHTMDTDCTLVVNADKTLSLGAADQSDTFRINRLKTAKSSLVDLKGNEKTVLNMFKGVTLNGGGYSIDHAAIYVTGSGSFNM